jgi:hypothetical protein
MPITIPARIRNSAISGNSFANASEGIVPAALNNNAMISGCAMPTPSRTIIAPKSILFVDFTGHPSMIDFFAMGGIRTLPLQYDNMFLKIWTIQAIKDTSACAAKSKAARPACSRSSFKFDTFLTMQGSREPNRITWSSTPQCLPPQTSALVLLLNTFKTL